MDKRERLIEKYRDINTDDHDWANCIRDQFIDEMAEIGITIAKRDVRWSGFWSPGDGASFTGDVTWRVFLQHHTLQHCKAMCTLLSALDYAGELVRTSHHYVHSNTVSLDLNIPNDHDFGEEPVKAAMLERIEQQAAGEHTCFEQQALALCRGHMDDLYERLRDEYEYITDDEQVWGTIEANNLDDDDDEDDEEDEPLACAA